jgi:hypothetical protein
MIDRPSRDSLATALGQYVSGRITNDDFDDVAVDWRDSGADAVKRRAWGLYDDTYQHLATGRHYITKPSREEIGRWILFLHSDNEYTWPHFNFRTIFNWPLNLLSAGWWESRKKKRFEDFKTAGDYSVWPFASRQDYEASLENPKYFAGANPRQ